MQHFYGSKVVSKEVVRIQMSNPGFGRIAIIASRLLHLLPFAYLHSPKDRGGARLTIGQGPLVDPASLAFYVRLALKADEANAADMEH